MRTLTYISLLLFLTSCNQTKNKKQKSVFKVVVNSNYRQYLWQPTINRPVKDSTYYDSIKNVTITQFDSLKNGKIELYIYSLLTDNFERTINLQKDTTIYFDTTFYHSLMKTSNLNEFTTLTSNLVDTIFIGQTINGCWTSEIEKIKVYKNDRVGFTIEYSKPENQTQIFKDSLFKNHFAEFLTNSRILFPTKSNGLTFLHLSTTHIDTYIRQGNIILEFPDLNEWNGYENFKKIIGIKTNSQHGVLQ